MKFDEQLDIYLRARFTLITLFTPEEERLVQTIQALCERTQRACLAWDAADGYQWVTPSSTTDDAGIRTANRRRPARSTRRRPKIP